MTIDSISDMATIIRNAIAIKNSLVTLPYTKNNEIIAKILAKEGFIHCVTTTNKTNLQKEKIAKRLPTRNNLSIEKPVSENNTRLDTNAENSMQNQKETSFLEDKGPEKASKRSQAIFSDQNLEKGTNLTTEKQKLNLQDSRFSNSSLSSEFKSNGSPFRDQKVIILALKYVGREKKPMIHAIKRVSKPSLRWYSQSPIPQSLSGLGVFIVSTSFGIITDKEARDKKVGGEILLEIW